MWFWGKGREVEALGKRMVESLVQAYPPSIQVSSTTPGKKHIQAVFDLYQKAEQYHQLHNLGIYTKAKLANTVRWQMGEAGYADDFVKEVAHNLAMRLAAKRKK